MQISHNGLQLVKDSEGFEPKAYQDQVKKWTIGYGTTVVDGQPVLAGMEATQAMAETWLAADMAATQTSINQSVKVPLSQNMFDGLCSLVYNIGTGNFQHSTLLRLLNQGNYKGAAAEFPNWDHAGGHVNTGLYARRLREQSLFLS